MARVDDIQATIAALEQHRAVLGDQVVESALAPLRRELQELAEPPASGRALLRQVSVLFVDVVGSTAIGQRLEPEDIHAVMDGALARFTTLVTDNFGRVLQYAGDGMLAAFGSDATHEDDAQNAVRAGLAILEETRRMAPDVQRLHGVAQFKVRVGVNTGTVLLGAGVDAEGSIRGSVVNVAARMEQTAPAGGLRISHDTYRQVQGIFEVVEQPPISIRGVDAPVRSYVVERERPRAQQVAARGIEGVGTRMVGRDRELRLLSDAFRDVAQHGGGAAVAIVGGVGLGKTRLLREFQAALKDRSSKVVSLAARAHTRSHLHPYSIVADLLSRHLQFEAAGDAPSQRSRLKEGLQPLFADADESAAHLLGHLAGIDFSDSPAVCALLNDPARLLESTTDAVRLLLQRLSDQHRCPVLLLLDDMQWSDERSLALLESLMRSLQDAPVLLVVAARPDLLERPALRAALSASEHQRIDLAPLAREQAMELADVLLQRVDEIPDALRELLVRGAEGNPFFMEELVEVLIEDGVIAVEAGRWQVRPGKLAVSRVPATLTGVLQSRMDSLSPSERRTLQHAAVIGPVFPEQALDRVCPDARQDMPALLRKRFLVRRAAGLPGEETYAFDQHLLYQVAYDTVLKTPKKEIHEKIGQFWSERAQVGESTQVTPTSSRALAEAHFHRCRGEPVAYVDWFDAQFSPYLNAYAAQTLRPLAQDVITVCEKQFGQDHPATARALTNLARVHVAQSENQEAEPLLRRALGIQDGGAGAAHPDTARTLAVLAGCLAGRGDQRAAEPLFRKSLAIREKVFGADHPLTVGTLEYLAHIVSELGRNAEAEGLALQLLTLRERQLGKDHPQTALALRELADIQSKMNRHEDAVGLLRRALAIQQARLPPDHPDTALSLWNLSEALCALGELAEAEAAASFVLQTWETAFGPDHEWTAWGVGTLAKIKLARGDTTRAAELAARAAALHQQRVGPRHPVSCDAHELHAKCLDALGQNAAAAALFDRVRTLREVAAP